MKPAPIDEVGFAHCGCGACRATTRFQRWHKLLQRGEMLVVKYCPDCGRAVGFDRQGKPVVGPTIEELNRDRARWIINAHKLQLRVNEQRAWIADMMQPSAN